MTKIPSMRFDQQIFKKVFAINLRMRLDVLGYKQNKFAKLIGMSPQQLSFYVRGERLPNEENLQKMADGLALGNPKELYRVPDGIMSKLEQETWNALIDIFILNHEEDMIKVRDYIQMVIEARKTKADKNH